MTGALGMRSNQSKAEREAERRQLQAARGKPKVWDAAVLVLGNIGADRVYRGSKCVR